MVKLSESMIHDSGNSHSSFVVAGSLILLGWVLTFFIDNRKDKDRLAMRNLHSENTETL